VAGCCECGDDSSGSCATELVSTENYARLNLGLRTAEVRILIITKILNFHGHVDFSYAFSRL
jgi:hypothetical protein